MCHADRQIGHLMHARMLMKQLSELMTKHLTFLEYKVHFGMFTSLKRFMVSERPMVSERKAPWSHTPVAKWTSNDKVLRAAERLVQGENNTLYVEDGDVYYKVRLKA